MLIIIIIIIIIGIQPVWAETRAQSGDWYAASCASP